jgi:probable F420-dependent oxidoreductase
MAHDRPFRFAVHSSNAADGATWMANARRVEELGFSTLLLRDHFDDQYAPIAAMTAAACATSTLRVGCLVYDNDYRHPLVLAKELATIDVLSGGRVEVGLGAGWMAPDYEQSGIPFDPPGVRVSRFEEAVQLMKGLFGDGSFDFKGDHYTVVGHDAYPKPVQRPHPPILVGGGGKRLLTFAAREADIIGLNPRRRSNEQWDDQNLPDATAEAADRKVGWIRDAAGARYPSIELSAVVPFVVVTDDREGFAKTIAAGLEANAAGVELSAKNVLASPYVLAGSVDEICDTLRERRERWDVSYLVFNDDSIDAVAPIVERLAGT